MKRVLRITRVVQVKVQFTRNIVLGLGITREDGKSNAKDYRKYSIPTGGHGNFIPMK